ncbi:MAG TPA: hypothetical protein VED40_03770 [Azospirillaceae bacterium]|nr:hypothetical protein [Azospirillaceae bacterium]
MAVSAVPSAAVPPAAARYGAAQARTAPPPAPSGVTDTVTLSPEAQALMARGAGAASPPKGSAPVDPAVVDAQRGEYAAAMREYNTKFMEATRDLLGVKETEGFILTGRISETLKKVFAAQGLVEPQKPAELAAADAAAEARTRPVPHPDALHPLSVRPQATPEPTASRITIFASGGPSKGSVDIIFNDAALDRIAKLSPEELRAGMVDAFSGGTRGAAANQAVERSAIGRFVASNDQKNPDLKAANQRFVALDPAKREATPLFVVQTSNSPDLLGRSMDEIVQTVSRALGRRDPADQAALSAASTASRITT